MKKPQVQVKVKEVVNNVANNHVSPNENIVKDHQKEQITRDKINAFESKINLDQKKVILNKFNKKIQSIALIISLFILFRRIYIKIFIFKHQNYLLY